MADEVKTEDEMAKAMEAMAAETAGGAPAEGEDAMAAAMLAEKKGGSLSQSEIDSLLGFDSAVVGEKTGIQALLDKSLQSYERLPMLEIVLDRFVRALSTTLRNFTSENVDVTTDSITSMRFEDYLNSIPLPTIIAIFQVVEWENYGMITIDSSLTYSMVDVLLGGGRSKRPVRVEGRPFTPIEQDIVKSFAQVLLGELSAAFNPLTPATFRMDRLESNPQFASITRPANAVILLSLRIEMEERGGKAEILLPYATIEPIKDLLTQLFSGESFGTDDSWESHLSKEFKSTHIEVEATLDKKKITLGDLAKLQVGSTIVMDQGPEDDVSLHCKGVKLISGKLGKSNKNVAVKVTDIVQKAMHDML